MTDGIDKYLDALKAGYTEEQARLFARSWAAPVDLHPQTENCNGLDRAIENLTNKISLHFKILYAFEIAIFLMLWWRLLPK